MLRRIIEIDENKCNGCGACAAACHEGAITMVDGKAKLTREDYCDGLGDCLPACPTGAITFTEREAPAYDARAVAAAKKVSGQPLPCGCPGTAARSLAPREDSSGGSRPSQLRQWPVQIPLVPVRAPWLDGADLLVAADCTAYAYADFHRDLMQGKVTLVGCPKLDTTDHTEKLTAILSSNSIRSVTVVRMEVPCCGGLERAVRQALRSSGADIPCTVVTVTTDGRIKNGTITI